MYTIGPFDLAVANIPVGAGDAGPLEELDLSIASGDHGEYLCLRRCSIKRLFFGVSGVATLGSSTVVFKKRLQPFSASGESVIGTLVVPAGLNPGQVLFKSIGPIEINAGESIQISWTQGTAGQGHARFELEPHTESFANEENLIEDES